MQDKTTDSMIACHDCDGLFPFEAIKPGQCARCPRCGAVLYQPKNDTVERSLALVLTGLILYIPANVSPIFILKTMGNVRENIMLSGVIELFRQGLWDLAVLVFCASILIPLVKLTTLFYVLTAAKLRRKFAGAAKVFRVYRFIDEWGMLEVYMLGILVALTKLGAFADVYLGLGFYSFIGLLLITVFSSASLDSQFVWNELEALK